ncbi:PQQ-dependent sugar dehydrogenase [Arthrobacter sp. I2-34]|uniref:PQQ-dependent sugar dehydrogenase n=1 Tax=Arthrobacter hankyongi TaxID=2904801 RepID=A0ABS9L6T7_9MICC|nr:PQQ-dependent sugar dehydrogenase [Arthrobacter hankyongi]MCG2622396.1 PQQ-dependent sugar dehydrogenase [Arthrobacter hankyongi]
MSSGGPKRRSAAGPVPAAVLALVLAACTAPAGTQTGTTTASTGTTTASTGATSAGTTAQSITTVASGLESPWSIAVLPDGGALVSENDSGLVKHIADGKTVAAVPVEPKPDPTGEGGLLGLALSPDFAKDRRVYVYLTAAQDNRVLSYRWQDEKLSEARVVLAGIPKARVHNGGRLKFGPDGYLYIGTGDAMQPNSAQDRSSLAGKILRVTRDGTPAPGNPFGNSPVYSYGHRNVQGLAWDSSGQLWASEFGPDRDDELNRIRAGGNYGWPVVTGAPGDRRFIDAVYVWPSTAEASPSGLAIVDDTAWLAALRGQRLWRVKLGRAIESRDVRDYLVYEYGRLRDVTEAPDGSLWILTNGTSGDRMLSLRAG